MLNPWLGIGLVLALLAGLMAGLRLYQHLAAPHPEVVRKLMHVSMGLATLSFPWLFADVWPVLVLAVASSAGLAAVRLVEGLKARLGGVLGGVARRSLGEFYFAVSVATLFCLTQGEEFRLVLYCVPLLILALADAVAALIGIRYGQVHYATVDGEKTAEGSIAFFTVAFFSVHVPLRFFTDVGRSEALLIALSLGFLVMLFEAIAWRGLDNLFIPLASFLVLKTYLGPPALELGPLATRLAVLVALAAFVMLWRRQTTLDGSALLAAAVVGYLSWVLGGWEWLLPPLTVFLTYRVLGPRTGLNRQGGHNVYAVLGTSSAGLVWLFLFRVTGRREFYYPFVLSFAAHLAIIGLVRVKRACPEVRPGRLLTGCTLKGWLLLFVPFLVVDWHCAYTRCTVQCALAALAAVALTAVTFFFTQPGLDNCPADTPRWLRQAAHAALGSALGLLLLLALA